MVCLMVVTAKRKRQQGKEKGKGRAIEDQVPRKALTNKMTVDLKEERAEGKSEASAQLVMGPSSCLALPGTEMLYLVGWCHLGFGPHQFNHPCPLLCRAVNI